MPPAARRPVEMVELRILDGPNLYFPRPAVKLTLSVKGWFGLPTSQVSQAGRRAKFALASGPGLPGTEQRRRYLVRLAVQLTRSLAEAAGVRVAVRGRPGPEPDQIVVAFPWRRRQAAEALAQEVVRLLAALLTDRHRIDVILSEAAHRTEAAKGGPGPAVPAPAIPVIAVTGTNGKTTTVRLVAHVARSAGMSVAYTTTDGVYRNDELVVAGDYSGFGGAEQALSQPGIGIAVLEIARGGILLRGMGITHNDVAIVTNVTEDHLDQYGIRTLDQLAEVKAAVTRITKPDGWVVLNADDPRVLAMRRKAGGRPWLFSLDHDHPAIREVLAEHGRAMTVIDGFMVAEYSRRYVEPLLNLEDIPVTLAGISTHNIRNALAASAGALGAGLSEQAVIKGLRTFVLDPENNPGRANLFELNGRVVLVDYAHNEDGMKGLIEICHGLRRRGSDVLLTFGSAGDRTNIILHRLGYTAARGADRLAIAQLERYLRGRDPRDLLERLTRGVVDGGKQPLVFDDELHGLEWMLSESKPDDVVAIAALGQRPEILAFLDGRGASRIGPGRVKELVRRVRQA